MYEVDEHLNHAFSCAVWSHFESISQVPRGSGNEEGIRQLLIQFANKNELEYQVDKTGNIIIYKPASADKLDAPVTILQSHVDMVNEKNDDSQHDFSRDPIQFIQDGEWIRANGTTLGADDGIGVAATLAILESNQLSHGPLEALFTVEEETTMTGAMGVEKALLKGRTLINIDSEHSDVLTVGCAGGINLDIQQNYRIEQQPIGFDIKTIRISGLKGGHSGCDIHLQRGNAILIVARILSALQNFDFRVVSIKGGTVDNAIPRNAEATIAIPELDTQELCLEFDKLISNIKNELRSVEPEIKFELVTSQVDGSVMNKEDQTRCIKALYGCLNGVHRFSDDFESVVETSSNLGVYTLENGEMRAECFVRSLVDSATLNVSEMIAGPFELSGAHVERRGFFPGWKPEPESKLLDLMVETYQEINQQKPQVEVIHAALECGIIGSALGKADMVSIGPIIENPHSPDERVNIASVDKFYRLLVQTLAAIE